MTEKLRFNLCGKDSEGLDCLTKHPVEAVTLARKTVSSGRNKIFLKLKEFNYFISFTYIVITLFKS